MLLRNVVLTFISVLFLSCNERESDLKETENTYLNGIRDFIFVGMVSKNPGLFKYNIEEKSYKKFWSDSKEKVVEVSYSENRTNTFFITSRNYGWSGAFPFVNTAKLYIVNSETEKTELLVELGNGLQVFAQWEDESNFRVIINSFDKKIANYVNHRVLLFNVYGKKLEDKTEIYDITNQGYPQLPDKIINYTSSENKYLINTRENGDSLSIFLQENQTEEFIIKSDQQIKQIEWGEDFVFVSLVNLKPDNETLYLEKPETSKLIIYSLENRKIVKLWEGCGIKNFFIINNFIVFDDGFENNSRIIIYDFIIQRIIDEIKIDGGCGIKNIPHFPDHGA